MKNITVYRKYNSKETDVLFETKVYSDIKFIYYCIKELLPKNIEDYLKENVDLLDFNKVTLIKYEKSLIMKLGNRNYLFEYNQTNNLNIYHKYLEEIYYLFGVTNMVGFENIKIEITLKGEY